MTHTEQKLGYEFKNGALLTQALTHPSYGSDHHKPHYQRLEFLGDAVLELYVSRRLYETYKNESEGKLTRMRADLVCEKSLSEAFKSLDIAGDILLSVGEERSGGRDKPSILCDVYEAVLGAIYLDGGSARAAAYIERTLGEKLASDTSRDEHLDYKSRLQAILQAVGDMPVYALINAEGPDHAPVFTYSVSAKTGILGTGSGHSKQSAQLDAAKNALKELEK